MSRRGATLAIVAGTLFAASSARAEEGRGVFFRAGIGPTFGIGSISEVAEGGTVYGGGIATELAVGGHVDSDLVVGAALFTTTLIMPMYDIKNTDARLPSHQYGPVGNHYFAAIGPFLHWEPTPGGRFSLHGALYLAALARSGQPSAIHYQYLATGDDTGGLGAGVLFGAAWRVSRGEKWDLGIVARAQYLGGFLISKVSNQLHVFLPSVLLSATYR